MREGRLFAQTGSGQKRQETVMDVVRSKQQNRVFSSVRLSTTRAKAGAVSFQSMDGRGGYVKFHRQFSSNVDALCFKKTYNISVVLLVSTARAGKIYRDELWTSRLV